MSETIGIDIGSHSIKLVGLKMTSKGPVLTHAGIKKILFTENKEDINLFSETIKSLYREIGLRPGKVNLTVTGSGVFIRRITLPSMPRAELKEAVRWEIKNYLPFPIESAEVDFHILDEFLENNVRKLNILAVACPKSIIERTLSIAEGAGLKPVHLDIGPFAIWNTLLAFGEFTKKEVIALIDLGNEKTGIHIFREGVLQFTRDVTPAGEDITGALMEGIISEEEKWEIYEKAEKIKYEMSILSKTSHLMSFVRPVLEKLVAEITRSLDYYRNLFNIEKIDRLLITGGGSNLLDIAHYLSTELHLPVEQFAPFKKLLTDSKKIDSQIAKVLEPMSAMFTVAAGIALPEIKRIELLPARPTYWTKERLERMIPVFSSAVMLIIFLSLFYHMNSQISAIKKEHDEKMEKVRKLDTLQLKLVLLKDKESRIKQDLSILPSSLINRLSIYEILDAVGRTIPDNVTVTALSFQGGTNIFKDESKKMNPLPITDGAKELRIKGLAFGNDMQSLTSVAQFIEDLDRKPMFRNPRLVTASENKLYNQPAVEFEIVCDINPLLIPPLVRGDKEGLEPLRKDEKN
ncbi:MAG: type IV pilus assembly protein PilM [Thermodesulfovibrionales bacterium]